MTSEQAKSFLNAVNAANIKVYEFDTDLSTRLYNNENAIIKFIESKELICNLRSSKYGGSHNVYEGNVQAVIADCADIHEARTAGSYDQIKSFMENLGATFSDSDVKILLDIDKKNYDIIPETGDYNRFVPLTQKQYDALTPEEKTEYDAAKAKDEKEKHDYIGQNVAASISLS